MDMLEFISETIKALAWPLILLIIVLIMKDKIGDLLALITKIKFGEIEVEIGNSLKKLKPNTKIDLRNYKKTKEDEKFLSLLSLSMTSPRAAILESWLLIEEAAKKRFEKYDASFKREDFHRHMRGGLEITGVLRNPKANDLFIDLRRIRNLAVHSTETLLKEQDAIRFVELSKRMIDYINKS
jgi:hypothetical protein